MYKQVFLFSLFSVLILFQYGVCEENSIKIDSPPYDDNSNAKAISSKYAEAKDSLLEIIDSSEEVTLRKIAASRVLSEMQLNEEEKVGLDAFLLKHNESPELKQLKKLPVEIAFIQTGIPTRINILSKIKYSKKEDDINLFATMLSKSETLNGAKFILKKELKICTIGNEKERLKKALSYLDHL